MPDSAALTLINAATYALLGQAWCEFGDTPRRPAAAMLPRAAIEQVARRILSLSLTTDEHRRIRPAVLLCHDEEVLDFQQRPDRVHWHLSTFCEPIAFTDSHVKQLAAASDPETTSLLVSSNADGSRLLIHGILIGGQLRERTRIGLAYRLEQGPLGLHFVTTAPALCRVSINDREIVEISPFDVVRLRRRGIQSEAPFQFFGAAVETVQDEVLARVNENRSPESSVYWTLAGEAYLLWVGRLLKKVRDMRHGGSFIFVPDDYTATDPRLTDHVRIRFACDDGRAWNTLINQWCNRFEHLAGGDAEHDAASDYRYQDQDVDHSVAEEHSDYLAHLAALDGAVLMTTRLRLLGFGSEVRVLTGDLHHVQSVRPDGTREAVEIEQFGTRHRAAFRICWQLPQALAFVISADGNVRAVRRQGDDIVMWPDVYLYMF